MNYRLMRHTTLIFALALLAPFAAIAAFIPTLSSPLEIAVSPSAPAPGSSATVSARSYAGNAAATTYVWRVDGDIVDQGLGRGAITVALGEVGSATVVTVSASEGSIDRGEASVTIRPADVDIVWEASSSVPPFSGILPLPNGGSEVIFVALPRVVGADGIGSPGSLTYVWRVGGVEAPALSGRGQSVFRATPPRLGNPFTVSVEVSTADGSAHAVRTRTVNPVEPEILVYEVAPLLGVRFERTIAGSFAFGDEATFRAFPLYMSEGDRSATTLWSVDDRAADATSDDPRQITLRKSGSGSGAYTIGFSYESAARLFEQARGSFRIVF